MANLETINIKENEIAKASDFQNGFNNIIENVRLCMKMAMENRVNWIIGGQLQADNSASTPQAKFSSGGIMGCNISNGDFFLDDNLAGHTVSFPVANNNDYISIVCVKSEEEESGEQNRAFYVSESDSIKYQQTTTRKHRSLVIQHFDSPEGSLEAQSVPSGFVKIAEVIVRYGSAILNNEDIFNCTNDILGEDNEGWTQDKDSTINVGKISDVRKLFREKHTSLGDHKENSILQQHILKATSDDGLKGSVIPLGTGINAENTSEENITAVATDTISVVLTKIASTLNKIYNDYESEGVYNAQNQINITNTNDNQVLTIENCGNNKAQLLINTLPLFSITNNSLYAGDFPNEVNSPSVKIADVSFVNTSVSNLRTELLTRLAQVESLVSGTNLAAYFLKNNKIMQVDYISTEELFVGAISVDGCELEEGDKVLVTGQTDMTKNGLYTVVANGGSVLGFGDMWQRITTEEVLQNDELVSVPFNYIDCFFEATKGSNNKYKIFFCMNPYIDFGITNIEFIELCIQSKSKSNTNNVDDLNGKIVFRDSEGFVEIGKLKASHSLQIPLEEPDILQPGYIWLAEEDWL